MIEVFKQCCFNRYFELGAAQALKDKLVNPPIYLSVGSEFIPPLLKKALVDCGVKRCNIFTQHRCHSYFLTFTDRAEELALELCGSPDGCNGGFAGSASISHTTDNIKLFGHDGLLGSQVKIGAGFAHASQELTIVICGDAAIEEDYALGALGYSITKKSPILYICEDNNLSLLTTKKERRSWDATEVAKAMGLKYDRIKLTDSLYHTKSILQKGINYALNKEPTFINIEIERHLWHAGYGSDGPVKYDYLSRFIEDLENIDPNVKNRSQLIYIEEEEKEKADKIWQNIKKQLKD